ncbi:MAG: hypothetical protein CVU39_10165 [Chloroflexi bacterium HGW-Chloroflexi-10]|nr:MAG: hypothetical protein CVU39_10165 [Chloroflexi bacterium HGW-Chloroflexi-10]
MIKIGDLFEITLSDHRTAIGHYVYRDNKNGPFIQVFDYIENKQKMNVEDAVKKGYMFPPVITGLKAAIRKGLWIVIGKRPVTDFIYPKFISAHWDDKTGEVKSWFLYNGSNFIKIGSFLDEQYKTLEYLVVWSPIDIISRVETGIIPFPYGEMIRNNKFIPPSSSI